MALLFDLAPGGVCRADAVTHVAGELLPHRFTLTAFHSDEERKDGGLLSVALSVGFPPLGVTQHPALRSPDFPPVTSVTGDRPAFSSAPRVYLSTRGAVGKPGSDRLIEIP